MLVVGIVLLFVFASWEVWFAKRPVVPLRFLRNRTFVGATWMCFFDFVRTRHFDLPDQSMIEQQP